MTIVLPHQPLVEPIQLLLIVKLQDQLACTPLARWHQGNTRSNVLLQFVECGLAIRVKSLAMRAWRPTARPARCHFFDLPDREFTAGRLLCKIEPQFRVLDGEQRPSVASSNFPLLD